MFTSKLEKLKSMIWPTSILVKQTGENVDLVPGIQHLIQNFKGFTFSIDSKIRIRAGILPLLKDLLTLERVHFKLLRAMYYLT